MRDARTASAFVRYNTIWLKITPFIPGLHCIVAETVVDLVLFVHGHDPRFTQTS